MPEYPEVTTVCRTLNKLLTGKYFSLLEIFEAKLFKEANVTLFQEFLQGEKIERIYNIGKFLVWELSNKKVLLSHLRMEGKFYYLKSTKKTLEHPHIRAIFHFSDGSAAYYLDGRMFGTFELRFRDTLLSTPPISLLAPNPFDITHLELFNRLRRTSQSIKTSLLNQRILLGLGNIYVDEVLHAAKILPTTPSNLLTVPQVKAIIKNSQQILKHATELGGSSVHTFTIIDTQTGGYQKYLKVYGRTGEECSSCTTKIIKIRVNNRGTHYCPRCQR